MTDTAEAEDDWLTPLREARTNLNMPFQQVADRGGVSYATCLAVFNGRTVPRPATLRRIVAGLVPLTSAAAKDIIERHARATYVPPQENDDGGPRDVAWQHTNSLAALPVKVLIYDLTQAIKELTAEIRKGREPDPE